MKTTNPTAEEFFATSAADFYSDRTAALREDRDTIAFLESKGVALNKHGNLIGEKTADPATDAIVFDLSRYTGQAQNADADDVALADDTPLDEAAALFSTGALAGEPDLYTDGCAETNESVTRADDVEDFETINRVAAATEARALAFHAQGNKERVAEEAKQAVELRALAAFTARNTFRIHALFSEAFAHAVNGGHWHIAQAHLIDAIKSDEADFALKVASTRALAEIATFAGDTGADFDGRWLAKLASIPSSTARDLIASAHAIESGVAVILTGTEHGGRKAFLEIVEMNPARRRAVVTAVKICLTRYLLENAIEKERKQRARNISIAELNALTLIGCNNPEGWHKLTTLGIDEGNEWLAAAVDEALRKRVLSERTEARASQTLSELKKRLHRNAAPRQSSRRNANNSYRECSK